MVLQESPCVWCVPERGGRGSGGQSSDTPVSWSVEDGAPPEPSLNPVPVLHRLTPDLPCQTPQGRDCQEVQDRRNPSLWGTAGTDAPGCRGRPGSLVVLSPTDQARGGTPTTGLLTVYTILCLCPHEPPPTPFPRGSRGCGHGLDRGVGTPGRGWESFGESRGLYGRVPEWVLTGPRHRLEGGIPGREDTDPAALTLLSPVQPIQWCLSLYPTPPDSGNFVDL